MNIAIDEFTAKRNGTNVTEDASLWSGGELGEFFFVVGGYIIFPIIILSLLGVTYFVIKRNNGAVGRA